MLYISCLLSEATSDAISFFSKASKTFFFFFKYLTSLNYLLIAEGTTLMYSCNFKVCEVLCYQRNCSTETQGLSVCFLNDISLSIVDWRLSESIPRDSFGGGDEESIVRMGWRESMKC